MAETSKRVLLIDDSSVMLAMVSVDLTLCCLDVAPRPGTG